MELHPVIEFLLQQRAALDETIACLERLRQPVAHAEQIGLEPKRRGRKFMIQADREKVSERMKQYWASRRMEKTQAAGTSY